MWKNFEGVFSENSEESLLLQKLSAKKLPRHIAIIMDGNGRWAAKRNLNRIEGHKKGGDSAQAIIECAARLGIAYLTLFAFSTENWSRPVSEVRFLFKTLYESMESKKKVLLENEIRLFVLGDLPGIPARLRNRLMQIMDATKNNQRMQLNLAFNYGSRLEIVQAVKRIIRNGIGEDQVDLQTFADFLYTKGIPDPDLVIRTSGECRISNFLLYQSAYSEFCFSPILWPDFRHRDLFACILDYQSRQRRYGKL